MSRILQWHLWLFWFGVRGDLTIIWYTTKLITQVKSSRYALRKMACYKWILQHLLGISYSSAPTRSSYTCIWIMHRTTNKRQATFHAGVPFDTRNSELSELLFPRANCWRRNSLDIMWKKKAMKVILLSGASTRVFISIPFNFADTRLDDEDLWFLPTLYHNVLPSFCHSQ